MNTSLDKSRMHGWKAIFLGSTNSFRRFFSANLYSEGLLLLENLADFEICLSGFFKLVKKLSTFQYRGIGFVKNSRITFLKKSKFFRISWMQKYICSRHITRNLLFILARMVKKRIFRRKTEIGRANFDLDEIKKSNL